MSSNQTTKLLIYLCWCLFSFTSSGKNSPEQNKLILSGCEYSYPPYCLVEDDKANGFSVELLRESLQKVGYDVSFKNALWQEIKTDLAEKRLQVLPLVGRTPEREDIFDFTFPYYEAYGTIVIRNTNTDIQTLADLRDKEVSVMKSDNAEEFLRRIDLPVKIIAHESFETCLTELSQGKHDAVFIQKILALQLIKKLELKNLKLVRQPVREFKQTFCFAVSEGDHELLSILNEGLARCLKDGTYKRLSLKWFSPIEEIENKTLLVGGTSNFYPYSFIDKDGNLTGFNIELTRAIGKLLNKQIEFKLGNWPDVKSDLLQGNIDLIQSMYYSRERDSDYDFSQSCGVVKQVIFIRKNDKKLTLDELADKKILVVRKSLVNDYLKSHNITNIISCQSIEHALDELKKGNADCAVLAEIPTLNIIRKKKITSIVPTGYTIIAPELSYATRPENGHLTRQISNAINILKDNGEYDKIRSKWFGIYDRQVELEKVLKYFIYIFFPLLIIILMSLLWSYSLKQKVTKATSELAKVNMELEKSYNEVEKKVADRTEELRKNQKRLKLALQISGAGIYEFKLPDNNNFYLSTKWTQILGYNINEIPLNTEFRNWFYQQIHTEDKPAVQEAFDTFLAGKITEYYMEMRVKHKSGKWLYIKELAQAANFNSNGEIVQVVGLINDITEQKLIQLEIKEHRDHLEKLVKERSAELVKNNKTLAETNRDLKILLYVISHDIREPLRSIENFSKLLKKSHSDNLNPKGRDFLQRVINAAKRLDNLLNDVLTLSRAKRMKQPADMIDPKETVLAAVKQLESTIKQSNTQIEIADDFINIKADPTWLTQAIFNLIANAIKFTPKEKQPIVKVFPYNTENRKGICVSDNGIGIKDEHKERIFELFQRAVGRDVDGTGAGLAIVRQIAERHNGSIWVKDNDNEGSIFIMTFDDPSAELE